MAPVKRTFDDALLGAEPLALDVVEDPLFPAKKLKEAADGFDLSAYLISDGSLDAVVPSVESLEDGLGPMSSESPWLAPYPSTAAASQAADFHELPGDMSDMSDSDGYSSLFNSPEHVLTSDFADPFLDDAAQSILITSTMSPSAVPLIGAKATQKPDARANAALAKATERAVMVSALQTAQQTKAAPTAAAPQQQYAGQQQPPVNSVRWAHNSTERKRRLEIRRLFSGLRDLFSDLAGDDKISNINTLNRAIDHVAELNVQTSEQDAQLKALRQRNAMLKNRAAQVAAHVESNEALGENADPSLRRQLPAALRQLLDHNGRGQAEIKPLPPRRPKMPVLKELK